ncbi:hypothetical protein EDB60_105259 [Vibrio crassostreae]|uniref:ComF family protein n=1 Tax=Vibrio crassostreae TaxID=246167 RepID=UPI00104321D5|nr:ComF family protein [Vibrio crassostreae]TCN70998.1 hypothetical protein EDB60_105259 [Vibrio crassostreae]
MNVNLKQIIGNWSLGYALDKHTLGSEYLGDDEWGNPRFNTTRSEAGEALYQLKYCGDNSQALHLATAINNNILPLLGPISFIVSMPPSKQRTVQPVDLIASELAKLAGIPYGQGFLYKAKATPQSKDASSKAEKVSLLKDALAINTSAVDISRGVYNVLLIDDLFDSGASLEAATDVLLSCANIQKVIVATATWK